MKCKQTMFRSTAFYYNPFLPPVLKDGIAKQWYDQGIQTFDKFYEEDTLMSFEQLQQKCTLPSKFFFKYLQIRHYIQTQQGGRLSKLPLSPLEAILAEKKGPKGLISFIYTKLLQLMAGNIRDVKSNWEKDLDRSFTDDEWKAICEKAQTFSINSRHKTIPI